MLDFFQSKETNGSSCSTYVPFTLQDARIIMGGSPKIPRILSTCCFCLTWVSFFFFFWGVSYRILFMVICSGMRHLQRFYLKHDGLVLQLQCRPYS